MQTLRRVRVIVISVLCTLALTCKKEPPPAVHIPTLALTAVDASCTEAWLKLTTTQVPATVRLVRLTPTLQTLQTLQLTTPDTLVIDEGLLPNRTYTYKAYRLEGQTPNPTDSTPGVQLTTMDTTSHNFTWQLDTLGTHSSVLYDVAIINDTLVYAVGEIFHRDSSENWTFFNLAKWNGREWTLQRVYYRGNNIIHTRWILAFAWNDIWITPYTHWDGTTWREVPFDPIFSGVGTNKAWGTSSSDFYVVGNGGFIAHYDGVRWRRIESGTTLPINDVWGGDNRIAGDNMILAAASDAFTHGGGKIIRVKSGSDADSLTWGTIYRTPQSIWFDERDVFVCGSTFWKRTYGGGWQELIAPSFYLNCVRGAASNDLLMVGHFGIVMHFNGWSLRSYDETRLSTGNYKSVAVRQNHVIAVGRTGPHAIAARGRRL
jgi:hypothetical protein